MWVRRSLKGPPRESEPLPCGPAGNDGKVSGSELKTTGLKKLDAPELS
jgi:hypothetical protein